MNDGPMKHPFLTGPRADGGLAAYGTRIDGTWEGEVERVLARVGTPVG